MSPTTRGWLIWGAAAALFGYAFLHRIAPSVMYDRLMAEFQASAAALGNLSACYFYAYAAMQLPAGMLLDRFGPRLVLTACAVAAALGSFAFASSSSLEAAYLSRILIGAGVGATFIGTITLAVLNLPPHRLPLAIGLTQSIAMGGSMLAQAPLALLVAAVGWRDAMLGFAALGLALGLVVWAGARDSGAPTPPAAPRGASGEVLRNPQTWLACLYCALMSGPPVTFAVLWGVPWLEQAHGQPRAAAAFAVSLTFAGWAVAAPALGWLTERLKARRPLMLAGAVAAGALWCALLWLPDDAPYATLCALIFAMGLASGAMPLSFVVGREANPTAGAFATAVVNFSSILAISLLQPLVGWFLDLQWDGAASGGVRQFPAEAYRLAFLLFPASAAVTLLGTLALRETHPARRASARAA